uniref:RRM domain-containing protein n=1 Tax=Sinocyclocheilus rhinocerous TaxID=307959 RepID=A0A673LZ43_9TELE
RVYSTMQSSQRLYIHLPEKNMKNFKNRNHGIVVTDLHPFLTHSELHNYFDKFGTITECVVIKPDSKSTSRWPKGVAFVRYSSSEEAKAAEEVGPHCLGGFHS